LERKERDHAAVGLDNEPAAKKQRAVRDKEPVRGEGEGFPKAGGAYSLGICAGGNFVFCSGQIGVDPKTGDFASPDVIGQTTQVIRNIESVLKAGGASLSDVVKTTVLLADINDFAAVNAHYATFFPVNPPARTTFQVAALPKAARIEIEAIAQLRQ